ncbi:hypothetical protein [Dehalococcoides mccartyi]|uniref:hypothetical protein n=1 Tax=Dehalococcoides mccartyi TaxID=61435 RepID=UPI0003C8ABFF|nr:hypothetical protein [Dehalococcoides mccartyi]AHB13466.1 hypothetical protein GY50_0685 [Dehalococcoides mccartyi GY50]
MELEKDTLNALITYLQAHGYPPEAFAIEFPIGKHRKYRADLAIIDPESREPIILFEIKQQRTPEIENMGRLQLKRYVTELEFKDIPLYLVFARTGTPPFEIVRVPASEEKETIGQKDIEGASVPPFDILSNSKRNIIFKIKKNAQKKQVDQFTATSLILAALVLGLLIADLTDRLSISAIHITLLVILVGLVLIPFASKIKFAGIEFERLKKEEKSK